MKQTAQFVYEPVSILEQWFLNMDKALAQRQNLHVQTMADGSVIAINKYASMSAYLAGREIVGQIEQILSHMRAARRELAGRVERVRSHRSHILELMEVLDELEAFMAQVDDRPDEPS
jgi:hypothetical protein